MPAVTDTGALAGQLAALPDGPLADRIARYLAQPDPAVRAALESPEVARRAVDALGMLQAAVQGQLAGRVTPSRRQQLTGQAQQIAALRRDLRSFSRPARDDSADPVRKRAERVLGKARYPELTAIMRDLNDGMSAEQALQAHQRRIGR
jgi:hypothetical protein